MIFRVTTAVFFALLSSDLGGAPGGSADLSETLICVKEKTGQSCMPVSLLFTLANKVMSLFPGFTEALMLIAAAGAATKIYFFGKTSKKAEKN